MSPLACLPRARPFSLSPTTSKRLLRRLVTICLHPRAGNGVSRVAQWEGPWVHFREAPDNLNAPNITQAAALFTQLKQRTEQSSSIDFDAWKKEPIMKYKEIGRAS